ncbi:DNA invertase Pin-like site-specific DNA recombinase [Paraburkholderia bannensis]|uniref:DNA invertase Pin-like site-specific DNA recombinase n=1 Tax=Paraburkholderia bannensis TaxID=765414 RepID=A0A7W9TTL0_9BURK|nr:MULTISPECIES: recombinase family protein [Paraburkholderia]MBB3256238.1 DNA invertase Pin-like site-specific DNA recombinase [Paraburkholderia sp. WP4_3_2]MBB6101238.1 DNA invertase Pin-like site-specific DNA recombinase [Paraburkholderia bannensis]
MPTAYSYVRFSTPDQLKGDSLRRQTEISQAYVEEHGLTLDTTLHFRDLGLSAFDRSNVTRGALGGFLEAIKRGRVEPGSFLLVESLDRLSRAEVLDAFAVFSDILKQGITIVTLADRMVYSQESLRSNFGNLIGSLSIMARAHEESAMKSRRLKAVWDNKREKIEEKKLTARCPQWMRLSEDRSRFEFIPERVETVRKIVDWSRGGLGNTAINKRLNAEEIPTFTKSAKGWQASSVDKILASHALYGAFQMHTRVEGKTIPDGDPVGDYFPAIITKEDFFLLQSIRQGRRTDSGGKARKGNDVPNLFSGLVKCGYCGSSIVMLGSARSNKADGTPRPMRKSLGCDGARRGHNCYGVQWEYTAFETSFLTFCQGVQLDNFIRDEAIDAQSNNVTLSLNQLVAAAKAEVDDIQTRLNRLTALAEMGDTPMTILTRIRELELQLLEKTDALDELDKQLSIALTSSQYRAEKVADVRALIERMNTMDEQTRFDVRAALAEHLRHMIHRIDVFPAGTIYTQAEIDQRRDSLIAQGYSKKRADIYLAETHRTAPKRLGQGKRGRYDPNASKGRHFNIYGKSGGVRSIYPDHDDPQSIIVNIASRTSKV